VATSTSSWSPSNGDSWSDSDSDWSEYGGTGTSVIKNSTDKWRGTYSIQIKDTFDSSSTAGLTYSPTPAIDASGYPYIDAWIYVDDISSLSVNVSMSNGTDTIYTTIGDISGGQWYHFEKEISSSNFDGWESFNISYIDHVRFYMVNSTPEITRSILVDEFHFELQPLSVDVYPAQNISVVSGKKVSALNNFTFDELQKVLGEDYKFRVEITEG
jgi:hypothetical protein